MILNWIIGVEGSGHHLLRAVARKHLEKVTTVDKGDYYPLLEQRWRPGPRRLPATLVKQELKRIAGHYSEDGVTHFYEDTSFPFGPSRSILTRPDIIDMLSLFDGICGVSILLLYRNPVETTFSTFRRGFSNSLAQECLFTEASHQHIYSQLSSIEHIEFRALDFKLFLDKHPKIISSLSSWMNIPEADFDINGYDPNLPVKESQIPGDSKQSLKDFFSAERTNQWDALYSKKPLVLI